MGEVPALFRDLEEQIKDVFFPGHGIGSQLEVQDAKDGHEEGFGLLVLLVDVLFLALRNLY